MVIKTRFWIASMVALLLALIAVGLGVWQLGRADEKRQMMERAQSRLMPIEIGQAKPWRPSLEADALDQQRVTLSGTWISEKTIALDNRGWEGQAGVHILTPVRLVDGSIIWVNRGWMAKAPAAALGDIPQAAAPQSLGGVALASIMKRMELSSSPQALRSGNLWQNFDWPAAQQWLPGNVWPVIVWQTQDNGDGLKRKLPDVGDDVSMHQGYAFQWFLMSIAALFFAWRLRPKTA
jgi:surfeit locus 1 family protein